MPVTLSGVNLTFVAIVGVIAVIALVMAMVFRREVLAASDGTTNMQTIARGVQEGASAYLGITSPHRGHISVGLSLHVLHFGGHDRVVLYASLRGGKRTLDAVVLERNHAEADELSVFDHEVELLLAIVVVPDPDALHGVVHAPLLH